MDARQIIDYAADDNAKDFREALYASIYDKVNAHIETKKQEIAHSLITQEEKECASKSDAKEIAKKEAEKEVDEHEDEEHGKNGEVAKHEKKMHKEEVEDLREAVTKVKDKSGKIIGHVEHNGDSWEHHHYGMKTSGDGYDSKKEAIESLHDHDNFFKTGKSPVSESLEEAVTRKHFQMVADLIKGHDDANKRKELAQHHAEIFAKQNPRFDRSKFMKAANASE